LKIRNGFVSNSSTSSFIVLLKKESDDPIISTYIEAIDTCLDNKSEYQEMSHYYEYIQERLTFLDQAVVDLENSIKEMEELRTDEFYVKYVNYRLMEKRQQITLSRIDNEDKKIEQIANDAIKNVEYLNKFKSHNSNQVKQEIESNIIRLKESICVIKRMKQSYLNFSNEITSRDIDGWKVFTYDETSGWPTKLSDIIEKAEKYDVAKIIYSVSS